MTGTSPFGEWIESVCAQFGTATGFPLCFAPPGSPLAVATANGRLRDRWCSELTDGLGRAGFLTLGIANVDLGPSAPTVHGMADLVAEMARKYLAASRRLESHSNDLSTLVEISRTVPTHLDLREALDHLLQAVLKLTPFRSTAFFLLDADSRQLVLRSQRHIEPRLVPHPLRNVSQSPPDRLALSRGKALLQVETARSAAEWLPPGTQTGCCLRVKAHSGPLGTLWAWDRRTRTPSGRELHVLESIAAQIAAVLERSVLLQESAVQQRLRKELKVASENQSGVVRSQRPRDRRVGIAYLCTSHYEVGGDLCESIALDEHHTLVAVGDAAGDSIPAALVMSALRGALWTLAARIDVESPHGVDTARLMQELNIALHSVTPPHQFMSLIVGVIDSSDMTFTYTNAGHPTPIVLHRNNLVATESHGMLLGVSEDVRYGQSTIRLSPDDLIVLFSDGISEARNDRRRMFRAEGIAAAVHASREESAEGVLSCVMTHLTEHTQSSHSSDDRSLLVARMLSPVDSLVTV
ncbi:MAG: SpoIIE family protein phosphatase [Planctomycetaceae bacterium]|nr:SpoIIE family protein phosphatase [Planctomycetaceae bacterium]